MGARPSACARPPARTWTRRREDGGEDPRAAREREEAIAQFPYVEFTGRDSVTCLTCQGTGFIRAEQVNELVALIPHSDQRLRPQRTKQYVLLSVLLCLLASGLVVFFLFPHSVLVDDGGIKVVKVIFNKKDSLVILTVMATLKIRNSNFYPVALTSLSSQVQYMNTVVGTHTTTSVSLIPPRSEHMVNFTMEAEMGRQYSYVYFLCTLPDLLVHSILIFMQTSVKISYIGHVTQSSLETHHYVDCGANSTSA